MRPDAPARDALAAGARNLLMHAAGLRPVAGREAGRAAGREAGRDSRLDAGRNARLLVVEEDPRLGWYEAAVADAVAAEAAALGARLTRHPVGGPDEAACDRLRAAVDAHDRVIFLARVGDRCRFEARPGVQVMCYARTAAALGSAYGRTDHRAMAALKGAVDSALLAAERIEIACPLGTALAGDLGRTPRQGRRDAGPDGEPGEVGIVRFPLGVPRPVCAAGLRGRVMLAGWLTPTGSESYTPATVALGAPVTAEIAGGRITALRGRGDAVRAVRRHHDRVGAQLGLDPDRVHSWHAGLHPACAHTHAGSPAADPDRWANTVFQNPRYLHFHTCGDHAPGEICWMVAHPTIRLDGVALWQGGRLCPDRFAPTRAALADWPELGRLMAMADAPPGV